MGGTRIRVMRYRVARTAPLRIDHPSPPTGDHPLNVQRRGQFFADRAWQAPRRRLTVDEATMRATADTPDFAILPWANVVKIGGQSIMDRGRAALMPVVDEIVTNLGRHKMILGTGAGTRARHIYSLAIDLGLPTGVLTVLGTAVAWQNAQMLHYLLAQYGIPFVEPEGFNTLPHYLMERGAVICQGM